MSRIETEKSFVDSNVVLYLLSEDETKANRAEALFLRRPTISVQVLNEVASICNRKLRMPWREVGKFLEPIRSLCHVVPLTVDAHDLARRLAERYRLSFDDACIVATASIEGCEYLYTEDMHDGLQVDGGPVLRNPFA
ncbi:VapC toxin family PIN domain ribonuclease [Burkholderia sp. HI2761]|uniref:PIN domain-containing protein n=1 Tax=unclassified Burkholderia TaxID=2613784 RepID=UPI000B7A7B76|nr:MULTISPECIES: PIN domain-containing protein [unclassified Burkholderia]MPV59584.1 PIN domain-containing protein [Burkholderia sp. BE24]OXJ24257.1 VapC toxin family PIN domain ribonuclease [Burkholderia sp. HI2761]